MEQKGSALSLPAGEPGTLNNGILIALVYLLVLQSPLERISGVFHYIDELVALAGALLLLAEVICRGRLRMKRYATAAAGCLLGYVLASLAGNLRYGYQPWGSVLKDLMANVKFFLSLLTGYLLAKRYLTRAGVRGLNAHLRIITVCLFVLFLAEQLGPADLFGKKEIRYGLRSASMIYRHGTYLAGAAAFLMAAMTLFYRQKNLPFIAMALVMLVFTLRSKALAAAAVYVLLMVFLVGIRGRLKLWHIALLGLGAVAIGWQQISFYFLELGGSSARSIMTGTSLQILREYFPLGTGFATYGSSEAAVNYSPVYLLYGFNDIHELARWNPNAFLNDTFWPIVFAQSGAIGTVFYLGLLAVIFRYVFYLRRAGRYCFTAGLFIAAYLLICSAAEPAFNNSVAVPLGVLLGGLLLVAERSRWGDSCPGTTIVFQPQSNEL